MKRVTIIVIVMLFFMTGAAWGQEDFEHVSSALYHDIYESIVKIGYYVYCGGRYGLQIFNVADSSNPMFIKNCAITGIGEIAIEDNVAFITKEGYGPEPELRIFDISDPLSPILLSSYNTIGREFFDMKVYENILFLAELSCNPSGLSVVEVIDVSDPSNPYRTDSLATACFIGDLFIRDGLLHVLSNDFDAWYNIWQIYSLDEPENPDYLGFIDFGLGFTSFSVSSWGNYAYIGVFDEIYIYDITDPVNPILETIYDPEINGGIIIIENETVYHRGYQGITTMDLSDPVNPEVMGSIHSSHGFRDLLIAGDTSFSLSAFDSYPYTYGLDIIDFSDLYNPNFIGHYYPPGVIYDVQIYLNYAYIAAGASGLWVVDISDPENPLQGNRYDAFWAASDIFIESHYAYLGYGRGGIKIYDLSNPADPVEVGGYNTMDEALYIFVSGSYAYIINFQSSDPAHYYVSIVDISDPAIPMAVDSIHDLDIPRYIHVEGNYAYISCRNSLEIFEVSDPYSVDHLGSHQYIEYGSHLFVEPPYAYVAASPYGIEIVDISDPTFPSLVGNYDSLCTSDISVHNGYAYLKGYRKLYLMNVSDPANPELIASRPAQDYSYTGEVILRGDYIYDPARSHLEILKLTETGFEDVSDIYPQAFALAPAYPNPFNASTTIEYDLPTQSEVVVEIYDLLGRKIETLLTGTQPAGSHSVVWDAEDVSSGVYFYRIAAGEYVETRKCLLLK